VRGSLVSAAPVKSRPVTAPGVTNAAPWATFSALMETVTRANGPARARRHPAWIRTNAPAGPHLRVLKDVLQRYRLHTVCEAAQCPNIGECWSQGAATFILMGYTCTRRCHFCAVEQGQPGQLDPAEPEHIARTVAAMNLQYAVLTSVNRDDLPDQGADHIARTIEAIRSQAPDCRVEMLIPDFRGDRGCVARVVHTPLTTLAHNVETVPRLYRSVRPGALYPRSLAVLQMAKQLRPALLTKSSLMLGLGETVEELHTVFADLRAHACDILTLGQYLRPSADQLPIDRYVTPQEFARLKQDALGFGFRHVEAGPLVRSSYHAWQHVG